MGKQGIGQSFGTRLAAAALGICLMNGLAAGHPGTADPPAPSTASVADPTPLEMAHWTGSYAYLQGELQGASFQAVRMPYGAGRRSMLIVLPDSSVNFGRFVAAITTRELNRWSGQLRSSFGSVSLPKLEVPDGLARTPLFSLGVGAPDADSAAGAAHFGFDRGFDAGLDRILASSRSFTMTVDRPFFYAVEDNKTHELLFVGVLMDPKLT
jgi:serine protease inhibitor